MVFHVNGSLCAIEFFWSRSFWLFLEHIFITHERASNWFFEVGGGRGQFSKEPHAWDA